MSRYNRVWPASSRRPRSDDGWVMAAPTSLLTRVISFTTLQHIGLRVYDLCAKADIHMYVYERVCVWVYVCVSVFVCMYAHMQFYIRAHMFTCVLHAFPQSPKCKIISFLFTVSKWMFFCFCFFRLCMWPESSCITPCTIITTYTSISRQYYPSIFKENLSAAF